ncbi:tail fiber domain-containing protein [Acerihabitans arboris]|uniref:Peptidase S74 domain-containing protein n=1 Tax=Acerihabitans arboris TaxID=2691583 RepID=A0A845SRD0_9GAMM|nr:tail fiber domain-containing protein [Acerihabitans arboris]NDL65902.1 hypothetical protein [Acerihabitans arboris]
MAIRTELGLSATGSASFASLELSGAAPFIDFHFNNTTTDYNVRFINSASGIMDVLGASSFNIPAGYVSPMYGMRTKAGRSAAFGGNGFMAEWNSSAQLYLWIDNTAIGQFTGTGSDRRIKEDIAYLDDTASDLDVVLQMKPVSYAFSQRGVLNKSGERRGFIAQDLLETFPISVIGTVKEGEENKPAEELTDFLNLDPLALCSVLAGAIKELSAKVDAHANEIAALKNLAA